PFFSFLCTFSSIPSCHIYNLFRSLRVFLPPFLVADALTATISTLLHCFFTLKPATHSTSNCRQRGSKPCQLQIESNANIFNLYHCCDKVRRKQSNSCCQEQKIEKKVIKQQ